MACIFLITQDGQFLIAQDGTQFISQDSNPAHCFAAGAVSGGGTLIRIGQPYTGPASMDIGFGMMPLPNRSSPEIHP